MSQVTCAGFPVAAGEIVMPLRGAWSAVLEVVASTAAQVLGLEPTAATARAGSVAIVVGGVELSGYATVEADAAERVTVRVVGGAGGLDKAPPAKHFVSQSRRVILTDALDAGAEKLSATSTDLDVTLGQWTRTAGTVGEALRRVADAAGLTWRVLADGSVWVGVDTWPTVTPAYAGKHEEPAQSRLVVAVEGLVVLPGSTFLGRRVTGVTYTVGGSKIRATVAYGAASDPLAAAIGTLVRRETAKVDFLGSYEARVVGQNADGTLELVPSDARLPGMSKIPIRPGVAGVTVQTVPSGSTALLGFANGDPARPHVVGFVGASATAITIDALAIKLGALATAFAARADLVEAELAKIATALITHVHGGVTAGFTSSGTAPPVYTAGTVAATKVLVQ